ncbi:MULTISPECIES: F0F1 ATP synthase subunit B [Aneurinibacillus]|uniref:ATP synthase subunit b n=1 Tax=Aneurinibacillus thermoaerophilus TaxID=143495 RepID=A0A1G8A0Z4_ANETH|nr:MULTISPECIES: F0F1 ATP synthase subunit B [Aneurinibacillus]AMA71638.1 ATP synthase F0F1 subunit B [Aneurinibacillus sp. XH2]MED0676085.1 F0F1 ATP synthase subunit B [Aneurinibacillus thermoaerophilus]MED0680815.1 F0F1 ATP synthase subunit B [Aneurinibacillus thermoaerophilus]MED0738350.1 F0F1 ATP synthase subunit B [Aneurinibacillus thermoaerophilus]MED0763863.1 F0F1 ATP synthase subunit B [Aneurinibacillus thermoaerophilus]
MLPQLGTLLFQVVVFLILLALVSRFAMKPAMSVLQKRQEHIEGQIAAAEKANAEAQALLKQQQAELKKVREEAQSILETKKKQAEDEAEQIIAAAQERAERMVEEAKLEINREKEKALASVRDQVAGLSVLLASKIIEKEMSQAEQQDTIEQFMRQVGGQV